MLVCNTEEGSNSFSEISTNGDNDKRDYKDPW